MINIAKIRGRMAELKVTQKEIASELNLAAPTVSQKLNQIRPMSLDEAEKIARILKIDESEFGEYFFKQ